MSRMMHNLQKWCECEAAGLQSVANDAEASTKKKRKVANTAELSNVAGTISA